MSEEIRTQEAKRLQETQIAEQISFEKICYLQVDDVRRAYLVSALLNKPTYYFSSVQCLVDLLKPYGDQEFLDAIDHVTET